jgi:hypothetical protein
MKNNYLYTIRRHLGQGKHKGWWQIREYISNAKQGIVVEYVDSSKFSIIFRTCLLYNRVNQAKKIINGAYKEPCAWICAGSYVVEDKSIVEIIDDNPTEISYNPKKSIHWTEHTKDEDINIDGEEFSYIYSNGVKLYI